MTNTDQIWMDRKGKCGACKHYNKGGKNCCPSFPDGIPAARIDNDNKCSQWADKWTRAELETLFDTKKGAEARILEALKAGKRPTTRDIELLNNKQGRPQKTDADYRDDQFILEDYGELRESGKQYIEACEILAERCKKSVSHIKALITKDRKELKEYLREWEITK